MQIGSFATAEGVEIELSWNGCDRSRPSIHQKKNNHNTKDTYVKKQMKSQKSTRPVSPV